MKLILKRNKNNGDTTLGIIQDNFIRMYSLEDEPRKVKVKGETRIPAGTYELKYREVLSPLTKKYRNRFPWFKWHLELQDVPGFDYVYVHIGNDDDDTDACILVGEKSGNWKIWNSTDAFTRFYHYVAGAFAAGERVFISILDEDGR